MWQLLTGAATALVVGPALGDWEGADANDDSHVDLGEFGSELGERGVFAGWDTDGDGALSPGEFGTGLYGQYDQDKDELWSEEEFGVWQDDDWM